MERKFNRFTGNLALAEGILTAPLVGFNAGAEIRSFKRNLAEGGLNNAFKELEENVKTWKREYAAGDKVFIGHYRISESGIVDQSGLRVAGKISPKERQGKVLSSWMEGEKKLLQGKDGDMWVSISPVGPTGLEDEAGNSINFVDTYIQAALKKGNEIRFITFRTGLDIHQSRRLLFKLVTKYDPNPEIPSLGKDAFEEASNIVGKGLLISGERASPADLIWEIASIDKFSFNGLSPEQILKSLQEAEEKFGLNKKSQESLDELRQFIFAGKHNLDEPGFEALFEEKIKQLLIKMVIGANGQLSREDIKKGLAQMQKFSGCAGSGSDGGVIKVGDLVLVQTAGGYRVASLEEKWIDGTCSICNRPGKISCNMCKTCADSRKIS